MLKNIYNSFRLFLSDTFPDIKIEEYRGEFKDKFPAGWNPSFPCCLIKLGEYSPAVRSASREIIKHRADFTLYIGEKNSLGFDIIQDIIDELNGLNLPVGEDYFSIEVNSVKFLTGVNAVRVHTIEVSIT